MIRSNDRKLCLSGWLQETNISAYTNPLKLQKFLFLYEAFSKTYGDYSDFSHLKGYVRGPVFSTVWGDYTKERAAFNARTIECYKSNATLLNAEQAEKCAFIVNVLTEKELSDLTHGMNIWAVSQDRIMSGERQVALNERDFTNHDEDIIRALDSMYPVSLIRDLVQIPIDNICFVVSKENYAKLTEEHIDTLALLVNNEELHNPVFVEVDDEGGLLID